MTVPAITRLTLDPLDNARLSNLCGPLDENLRQIEQALDVAIAHRANRFDVRGAHAAEASQLLEATYAKAGKPVSVDDIQLAVVQFRKRDGDDESPVLRTRRADLVGRTAMQRQYIREILKHDITFGVGPAGTGKTYLAVACAVDALERDAVQRIVLTRPAVEAGERLGFLPGDLSQKIDPYLRPLYDALYDLLGFDKVQKLHERNALEIAPLAYMRGRTLNHAFVILDEAQNTTPEQMKMFLTRIGFGSRAVVTGDVTQVDLARGQRSGLADALEVLQGLRGLSFTHFTSADVVRHPLVGRIVDAYEHASASRPSRRAEPPLRPAPTLQLSVQYAEAADIDLPDRQQLRRWIAATLDALSPERDSLLTVRFVSRREARALNRDHRHADYVPNVLTFALHEGGPDGMPVMADIVICPSVVRAEARAQRKSAHDHMAHMTVHGVLHAHGYDHQNDAAAGLMESLERFVLQRFRIDDPYVVRPSARRSTRVT